MNESPRGSKSVAIATGFVVMIGSLLLLKGAVSESRAGASGPPLLSPEVETVDPSRELPRETELAGAPPSRHPAHPTAEARPASEGWVVDADGGAIPRAVTRIADQRVVADERGHFTWWFLPEDLATPRLQVCAPGFRSRTVEPKPWCTVVLPRAVAREVEIWDPDTDRPISGAELRVYHETEGWRGWAPLTIGKPRAVLVTDASGRAVISAELDQAGLALGVRPPGGVERVFQKFDGEYRGDRRQRFEVGRLRPLGVRVVRAGRPVSGVLVRGRDGGRDLGLRLVRGITDGAGLVTLDVVGRRVVLRIEGHGLDWQAEPELEPWPAEVLVEVPDESVVHGRLIFAGLADLASVEVGIEPAERNTTHCGTRIEWTSPEVDGSWSLEPERFVSRWSLFLRFNPGGHWDRVRFFEGALAPEVEVPATGLVEVEVIPPAGVAPDELDVRIEQFARSHPSTVVARGEDGGRRARVPVGNYVVRVDGPGGTSNRYDLEVDAPRERIEVDLSGRSVEGAITYGGEPARGVPLRGLVPGRNGWDEHLTETDGAGEFRLVGLPPGEVPLFVSETETVRPRRLDPVWRGRWFTVPPGVERFDIELEAAWLNIETRGGSRADAPDRIVLCRQPNGTTGGRTRLPGDVEAPPGPMVREWSLEGTTRFRCRPGPGDWIVCYLGADGLVIERELTLEPGGEEYVVFDRGQTESHYLYLSGK